MGAEPQLYAQEFSAIRASGALEALLLRGVFYYVKLWSMSKKESAYIVDIVKIMSVKPFTTSINKSIMMTETRSGVKSECWTMLHQLLYSVPVASMTIILVSSDCSNDRYPTLKPFGVTIIMHTPSYSPQL